jgi:predicted NBD/HSP70 family sugar kinase
MLFLGIDVSKDKLDGAAVSEGTGAVLGRRSVPNPPDGVARLRRWAETIAGPSESAGIHASSRRPPPITNSRPTAWRPPG